jgi:hypothetical protein
MVKQTPEIMNSIHVSVESIYLHKFLKLFNILTTSLDVTQLLTYEIIKKTSHKSTEFLVQW